MQYVYVWGDPPYFHPQPQNFILSWHPNFAQNVTLSPDSPAQRPDQPWHTLVASLPHLNSPLPLMVNLKLKFLLDVNSDPGGCSSPPTGTEADHDLVLTRASGAIGRILAAKVKNEIQTSLTFLHNTTPFWQALVQVPSPRVQQVQENIIQRIKIVPQFMS